MRVVVQRVAEARVTVAGAVSGTIGRGLLVLAGFEEADTVADLEWMARKLLALRIFPDAAGVMNRSVLDAAGLGRTVPTGVFGADMQVGLVNDGPVTLSLDSRDPE